MGRGRAVIGGTLHTPLTPADVRQVIFDGFFPQVPRDAEPPRGARAGLHEMGLPYVSDPAITRHLAAFLKRHLQDAARRPPAAILFNGGVFQPASLRERVVEVMRHWYDTPGAALAAAGADESVARSGRRLGRGLLRLAASTPAAGASAAASRGRTTSASQATEDRDRTKSAKLDPRSAA